MFMKEKFARRRHHSIMSRMFPGIRMKLFEEIDNKEEAIGFLELQVARVNRKKKRLHKGLRRMDILEDQIEQSINEIGKLKDFSKDEMKKILKKHYYDYAKKIAEED